MAIGDVDRLTGRIWTMRDEFAKAALGTQVSDGDEDADHIAKDAYAIADAMMKEREGG